jgi:ribosomal subunit interface protein
MDLKIQGINVIVHKNFEDFITTKMEKMFGQYPFVKKAEIHLKKNQKNQKNPDLIQITMDLNQAKIHAEHASPTFRQSAKIALEKLKKQVEKYKGKVYSH